ncbi:hypothetical protein [Cerasicoccus frondis]|uniref:hypothetical protein n=1 Tax=Cerasicoccus frondis TaxID=490090 RepID=UPI002852AA8D|nr:hypothetical protein [Cerasicoccus frondis]
MDFSDLNTKSGQLIVKTLSGRFEICLGKLGECLPIGFSENVAVLERTKILGESGYSKRVQCIQVVNRLVAKEDARGGIIKEGRGTGFQFS